MNLLLKSITTVTLSLAATAALATPKFLITHNETDVESNAWVDNIVPSTHPTKAKQTSKVSWVEVRMACSGRTKAGKCSAVIYMKSNTDRPVPVGQVTMDLSSGEITPKELVGNGYQVTINGFGETTLKALPTDNDA